MYVFDHASNKGTQQSDWSNDELKDYRYIGADPNNYVTFNNETAGWRIIGIETVDDGTGKREQRIKLIRKDLLPVGTDNYLSWDNKPSGTGSSESSSGSNDWYDSRLMYLLNPNHEGETTGVSGSIYWNRQSGKCPKGTNNATMNCDFSEVGLLPEAQAMIGDAKWYLGTANGSNYTSASNGTSNHWYSYERGETVYSSSAHPRKTNWTGKVGLMYPSDYGYATSGGSSANRETCLAKALYSWDSSSGGISDCKTNDWLYNSSKYQWTIAPRSGSSNAVFAVTATGCVEYYYAYDSRVARPVVYLKADTLYQSGDGSESNPFVFTSNTSDTASSSINITSNKKIVSSPTKVCQEEVSTGIRYNFDIDSTSEIKTGSVCTTSNGNVVCTDYNNDIDMNSNKSCMNGNRVTSYTKSSNSCSYVYVCDNNNKCSAKREC